MATLIGGASSPGATPPPEPAPTTPLTPTMATPTPTSTGDGDGTGLNAKPQQHDVVTEEVVKEVEKVGIETSSADESTASRLRHLEDELKKVSADRDHWRQLALTQKHSDVASLSDDKKLIDQLTQERDKLADDVGRLRGHLISVEEGYTQEFLLVEEREKQLQARLELVESELEEAREQLKRCKNEALEEQIRSLKTQRDMALNENSQLDDKLQQHRASIANLQLVIEQIQKENDAKLRQEAKRHQTLLADEQRKTDDLLKKLKAQEEKFGETIEALGAASRLSETIDMKEQAIEQLKIEVSKKGSEIADIQQRMVDLRSSCEGKVDKQVMKSLVLGYFTAPHDKRHEVERLLARILDFNQDEMARAKITIGRMRTPSGQLLDESLSKRFVEFLEQESMPSPNSKAKTSAGPSKEVAMDLSKSLLTVATSGQRNNPFLASASPIAGRVSRSHSRASSTDSQEINQLLMGPSMATFSPVIVSASEERRESPRNNGNGNGNTLQAVLDLKN